MQVPVEVEKIEYVDKIVEREVEELTETTVTVILKCTCLRVTHVIQHVGTQWAFRGRL